MFSVLMHETETTLTIFKRKHAEMADSSHLAQRYNLQRSLSSEFPLICVIK